MHTESKVERKRESLPPLQGAAHLCLFFLSLVIYIYIYMYSATYINIAPRCYLFGTRYCFRKKLKNQISHIIRLLIKINEPHNVRNLVVYRSGRRRCPKSVQRLYGDKTHLDKQPESMDNKAETQSAKILYFSVVFFLRFPFQRVVVLGSSLLQLPAHQ